MKTAFSGIIFGGNVRLDALAEREQVKLRRWHRGNQISIDESRQGLSKPLDDQAVLDRLCARLAAAGITA